MSKRQTRRSISVNRVLFERAKLLAAQKGLPLAQLTEVALDTAIKTFYRNDGNP